MHKKQKGEMKKKKETKGLTKDKFYTTGYFRHGKSSLVVGADNKT